VIVLVDVFRRGIGGNAQIVGGKLTGLVFVSRRRAVSVSVGRDRGGS